jgi:hypothetical protein
MRLTVIVLAVALALPGAASAADTGPTPSTPSPTPPAASTSTAPTPTAPSPTTTGATPTTTAPAPAPTAKPHHGSSTGTWLLAILAALVLLSAVFAGLAWWFGWSAERFVGRGGASWRGLEEFGDWIRTGS